MTSEFPRLVKLDQIGTAPRTIAIEPTTEERVALAGRFGLLALDALAAELSVRRDSAGVRVTGRVRGKATQPCVISDEPVLARIDTPIDLLFAPEAPATPEEEVELSAEDCDVLPLEGQAVDLGEAVAQTFGLALDPYPRSPAAAEAARQFLAREEDIVAARNPFAALKRP